MDTNRTRTLLLHWVGLAAAYYLAGRPALLLAIPPGFASPVWPAAGVALASLLALGTRAWPGIVLGSFLINASASFDGSSTAAATRSLAVAASIGLGAALQALFGSFLIRRFTGFPDTLGRNRDIYLFMAYGGPVSCVIGAVWGVTTLAAAGLVPWSHAPINMGNWWVGDTIGNLLMAPALLIWLPGQGSASLRQRLNRTIPLCVTLALAAALSASVRHYELQQTAHRFDRQSDELSGRLKAGLDQYAEVLASLAALYRASKEVDRAEFSVFTEYIFRRHPEIQALEWLPRVTHDQRAALESGVRREGFPGFSITERSEGRALARAERRAEYAPVVFVEPRAGNEAALGYDLASDPVRRAALNRARDENRPIATSRISLVQDKTSSSAILIFRPIYRNQFPKETEAERRRALQGYVLGVFRLRQSIEVLLEGRARWPDTLPIHIRLTDRDAPEDERLLYESSAWTGAEGWRREELFTMAGRRWALEYSLSQVALMSRPSLLAWLTLVAGLLLAALLGTMLLTSTVRSAEIEAQIQARTAELSRSNQELEQFAYITSHDLQQPLRQVSGNAAILAEKYKGRLDAEADEILRAAVDGTERMQTLILELLEYSRLGRHAAAQKSVDCEAVLSQALANLSAAGQPGITHDPLPIMMGHRTQLIQLFQNLLDNALKFRGMRAPRIHVGAELRGNEWHFSFRDNGLGIDTLHHERIFQLFQRLHGPEYPGKGMGLAYCKKIVEQHGGRLWVASRPGEGSTFYFTLPRKV